VCVCAALRVMHLAGVCVCVCSSEGDASGRSVLLTSVITVSSEGDASVTTVTTVTTVTVTTVTTVSSEGGASVSSEGDASGRSVPLHTQVIIEGAP